MTTIVLNCGCVISKSMFGARNIVSISLCAEHQEEFADEMWAIVEALPKEQGMQNDKS
jgi:hypothetical protein